MLPSLWWWITLYLLQSFVVHSNYNYSFVNDSWPFDYELRVSENGITDIINAFASELDAYVLGTKIPAISSPGIDTQPSYFTAFGHDELSIDFQEEQQTVMIELKNVTGSLHKFDFVAKQPGIFTTVKCKGSTEPSFSNWSFYLSAQLTVNESCLMDVVVDDDALQISQGQVDFDYDFEDNICDSMIKAFSFAFNLEQEVIDDFIYQLPTLIVKVLKQEIERLLPNTQNFQTSTLGVSSNGQNIGICYLYIDIMNNADLVFGIDFLFNDTISSNMTSISQRLQTVSSEYEIGGDISVEVYILIAIIILGLLIGMCCMSIILLCSGQLEYIACSCCSIATKIQQYNNELVPTNTPIAVELTDCTKSSGNNLTNTHTIASSSDLMF